MKIIITQNKVERLKDLIKNIGTKQVINLMGGWDTFCKVMNIEGFMDFLHLFDDLDVVQSDKKENFTLGNKPNISKKTSTKEKALCSFKSDSLKNLLDNI